MKSEQEAEMFLAEPLLPCPFCGLVATAGIRLDESLWSHEMVNVYSAGCIKCDYCMEDEIPRDVLARWNQRAIIPPTCAP